MRLEQRLKTLPPVCWFSRWGGVGCPRTTSSSFWSLLEMSLPGPSSDLQNQTLWGWVTSPQGPKAAAGLRPMPLSRAREDTEPGASLCSPLSSF